MRLAGARQLGYPGGGNLVLSYWGRQWTIRQSTLEFGAHRQHTGARIRLRDSRRSRRLAAHPSGSIVIRYPSAVTRLRHATHALSGSVPVHTVLVAITPVLFLFAENVSDQVVLTPLWEPLAISAAIGAGALAFSWLALGDSRRGALLATLAIVLFFYFGHAWYLVGPFLPNRIPLVAAWGFIAVAGAALIVRGGSWVQAANRYLSAVAALLVAVNVVRIGAFALSVSWSPATSIPPGIAAEVPANPRNVYFIVLDRYASNHTLEELYGYDNSGFLSALRQRGFVVAEESWANYARSGLSLLSTLTMDYLDGDALARSDPDPPDFTPVHVALRGSLPVPQTLKALGYTYVHIGNYWAPTAENVDADVVYRYRAGSELSASLWGTTALMLLSPLDPQGDDADTIQLFNDYVRQHTLFAFDSLEAVANRDTPTYVFAHFVVPHPPYVFDIDGSVPTEEERAQRSEREEYVRQLQWTNRRILGVLDRLLDVPDGNEPIIILAADEGPFPPPFADSEETFDWLRASPEQVQQKYGILNAFHLPDVDPDRLGFHDRMSPVNSFRLVFSAYFGSDLPLLPDKTFLSPDYPRMYDFTEYRRP
jgi:hypothetical protein